MNRSILLIFVLLSFSLSPLFAQIPLTKSDVVGQWQAYLPTDKAIDVASGVDHVVYLTNDALVYNDFETGEISVLSKVNGLFSTKPVVVAASKIRKGETVVAYQDGSFQVFDFLQSRHVNSAIRDASIAANKNILNITYVSDSTVALCTAFGYLLVDPIEGIILEDIRLPYEVNDIEVVNQDLYLATKKGLRKVSNFRAVPSLRDTSLYQNLNVDLLDIPYSTDMRRVLFWKNEIYTSSNGKLHAISIDQDTARLVYDFGCYFILDMDAQGDQMLTTKFNLCGNDVIDYSTDGVSFLPLSTPNISRSVAVAIAPDQSFAIAGLNDNTGICKIKNPSEDCECQPSNGPRTSNVYDITVRGNTLAVAPGGLSQQGGYTFNTEGVFVFREDKWTNYNNLNSDAFKRDSVHTEVDLSDFLSVAIDSAGSVYGAAFLDGVVEMNTDGTQRKINELNSSLEFHVFDSKRVRTSGVAIDKDDNLWVINSGARNYLHVFDRKNNRWHKFRPSCGNENLFNLTLDPNSTTVWATITGGGILAFDTKGTFEDTSDDECKVFTESINNLPSNNVSSIHLDRQGSLWIGTSTGIAFLGCAKAPFSEFCSRALRPTAVTDGITGYLLDGQLITAITSDGGNRKWIGTTNGLFLLDRNGRAELNYFTAENSALLSDVITALAYDGATGKLWVGTDKGLMSYQTKSSAGLPFAHDNIEVYPQPVRPEYRGPITMKGFAQDSNVKITDSQGQLIFETEAIGGTATWDGRDYLGREVQSGVYLIWAIPTSEITSPPTVKAKIAIVR